MGDKSPRKKEIKKKKADKKVVVPMSSIIQTEKDKPATK